jgi:hypothetical protein
MSNRQDETVVCCFYSKVEEKQKINSNSSRGRSPYPASSVNTLALTRDQRETLFACHRLALSVSARYSTKCDSRDGGAALWSDRSFPSNGHKGLTRVLQ